MRPINVHDAKTNFSKLLDRVAQGEEITLAKAGKPVAKLVPIPPPVSSRAAGSARGQVKVGADFDDPLPRHPEPVRLSLLLDTHTFLWWIDDDPRLSDRARVLIGDAGAEVFISAVSGWELVIKAALGRIEFPAPPQRFIPQQLQRNSFQVLPVHLAHTLKVAELPDLHRDPFDRMLIAQALVEELQLVTADDDIRRYPVSVAW